MRMNLSSNGLLVLCLCAALPAHAVFKCVDEKGVTHYGDTMPPQCEKKAVTEISKDGNVIRKYDAPLTPEQIKAREAERLKQTEMQQRTNAQRQKDLALLATYGSEREFDVSRDRDLLQLDGRVKTLKQRIAEVDVQITKFKKDMEFYESDGSKSGKSSKNAKVTEVPEHLTQGLARADADRAGLDEEMAKVERDKQAVTARYEANKVRWKQMKAGMPPGTLADTGGNNASPAATAASEKKAVAR